MLGIFLGFFLYPKASPRFPVEVPNSLLFTRVLTFLGQHAFIIYLVHVPIIVALLYAAKQSFLSF
jgi:peptidoglycan/LPS O-acetylase OafA/YrhL